MIPAIEIKHVDFSYDHTPLFENISFTIDSGDLVGIIGPNGGGKSTLLKLLLGFLEPEKGSISLFGKKVIEGRKKIGYVPQSFYQESDFPISVIETVLLGGISLSTWRGYPETLKKRARDLLSLMDLSEYEKKPYGALSGGQKQRVLIAKALLCEPELIILDEPLANIDPEAEEKILSLILSLKKKKTILLVSHHITTVVKHTDYILSVHRGVERLLPQEVCEHFALGLYHEPIVKQETNHFNKKL